MSDSLSKGTWVASNERRYKVLEEIGSGGQGNVYLVESEGMKYALKWYNKTSSTVEQYRGIELLVDKGAPSEKFIWPLAIVEGESKDNFGYVMPLIDTKRYTKLTHYFGGEIKVKRYEYLIDACIKIAHGYNELHLSGLCYRDISFGNLFVDFSTGDILICDNDNVTIDNLTGTDQIWGTQGFMAPEVVRGEQAPSTQTDLFSLSVVLFRMLHLQHPLQGKREYEIEIVDYDALVDLYGKNPVFIYDPIDETNRPVKGKKDIADGYWQIMPSFIKERFTEAFTVGLNDPNHRVRESIWIRDLLMLKASLMYCYQCGAQLFYDRHRLNRQDNCPHCNTKVSVLPPRLRINDRIVMLNHDTVLSAAEVDDTRLMEYEAPYMKVEIHPRHPEIWGIKNLSDDVWRYTTKDGTEKEVVKDGVIPMREGQEIVFGRFEGQIRMGVKLK